MRVWKDENIQTVASLNKLILGGGSPHHVESGIPPCPCNYIKNEKARDLLDTSDPRMKCLQFRGH